MERTEVLNTTDLWNAARQRLRNSGMMLWVLGAVLSFHPGMVQGQFSYRIESGKITITGYTGSGGAIAIPVTLAGLPVTRIGDDAFSGESSLTSVTIPAGVTSIGQGAFEWCSALTNLTMASSVTNLGSAAFQGCSSLARVTLSQNLTYLPTAAFQYCNALLAITIPPMVKSIDSEAFDYCTSLTNVTFPNGVTNIAFEAFYNCASLTEIKIPDSVTTIEQFTFYGCTSLTNVIVGKGLKFLERLAFGSCNSLNAINVDALNPNFSSASGVVFDKSRKTLVVCPAGKTGAYTIPSGVTTIGYDSFCDCRRLYKVVIPSTVRTIEWEAFGWCTGLTNITIPASVTQMEAVDLFAGCTNLSAITVAVANPAYSSANGVLFNKSGTVILRFPEGKAGIYAVTNRVTSIEWGAFRWCRRLRNITVPNSVTNIGDAAFEECSGLISAALPTSLSCIQSLTFANCTQLSDVAIPGGVNSIGSYAFAGCTALTNVTFPASLIWVDQTAFESCSSLISFIVNPDNPAYTAVDGVLLDSSQTLLIQCPQGRVGNYRVPNGISVIGQRAFYSCNGLTTVTMPAGVTSLGEDAFRSCENLTGVYFQGNAPSAASGLFDYGVTVYHLPGTEGWGKTFSNGRTALWGPQIQMPPDQGEYLTQFGFNIAWVLDRAVVVEACTNLASPVWVLLATNKLTGGTSFFRDPQRTNYARRFYRIRAQ